MTTMIEKSVEIAIVGNQKAGRPKAAAHSPDAQTLIVEKLIAQMAPDVLKVPASIDHNPTTKGQLIRASRNMESSQRLRRVHSIRPDFTLR